MTSVVAIYVAILARTSFNAFKNRKLLNAERARILPPGNKTYSDLCLHGNFIGDFLFLMSLVM